MKSELEQRDDEISDHVSSLETLVERLNTADSLLRVKEQQVGAEGCEGGGRERSGWGRAGASAGVHSLPGILCEAASCPPNAKIPHGASPGPTRQSCTLKPRPFNPCHSSIPARFRATFFPLTDRSAMTASCVMGSRQASRRLRSGRASWSNR